MALVDHLETIQCGCERQTAVAQIPRADLVAELVKLGFGSPGQAVPTDWGVYYNDDELREFVLEYAEGFTPSA